MKNIFIDFWMKFSSWKVFFLLSFLYFYTSVWPLPLQSSTDRWWILYRFVSHSPMPGWPVNFIVALDFQRGAIIDLIGEIVVNLVSCKKISNFNNWTHIRIRIVSWIMWFSSLRNCTLASEYERWSWTRMLLYISHYSHLREIIDRSPALVSWAREREKKISTRYGAWSSRFSSKIYTPISWRIN